MLYSNPSPRLAAFALLRTFIYPWDSVALGSVVCALAAIGGLTLLVRDRRTLAAGFAGRGAVSRVSPAVPGHDVRPLCAAAGAGRRVPRRVRAERAALRQPAVPAAGALAVWAVAIAAPVLAAYAQRAEPDAPRPGGDARAAWHVAGRAGAPSDVSAAARGRDGAGDTAAAVAAAARVARARALLARRPRRAAMVSCRPAPHRSRARSIRQSRDVSARLSLEFLVTLPDRGDATGVGDVVSDGRHPGWFAEEGWALTPETAGIARLMGRGPGRRTDHSVGAAAARAGAAAGRRPAPRRGDGSAGAIRGGDRRTAVARVGGGAGVLRSRDRICRRARSTVMGPLARLTIQSAGVDGSRVDTAIEQFDLQSKRVA